MNLAGRVVLITGGSAGLGAALARAFGRAGCRVAVAGRHAARTEAVAAGLCREGCDAQAFLSDLRNADAAAALADDVTRRMGPIAILVNNAGFVTAGLVSDVPLVAFRHSLAVNLLAPVTLIQAVLPSMLRAREGAIVMVSSGVALRALPGEAPYSAAKAALSALADSLRVELRGTGVSVTTVYPGRLATEINANAERYGDGATAPDPGGAAPERVARRIVAAVKHGDAYVIRRGPAWLAWWLHRFVPGLVDRVLAARFRR